MNSQPLVSVVTIFKDEERFLSEAVESVFAQTYPNWELLLVDDGSTDASTAMARRYAEQHPQRVRYLEHEHHANRGLSATRNLGARHARGEFIGLLDGDDVWLPQKLECQVPALSAHPDVGMLYSATEYWYSWTGKPEHQGLDRVWNNFGVEPNVPIPPPRPLLHLLRDDSVPCPTSVLLRRDAFWQVGGFEEYFRSTIDDQAFYAKMALQAPMLVINGCWNRYRQHPNSNCSIVERLGLTDAVALMYLTWLENLLYANKLEHEEIWRTVRCKLANYRHSDRERLSSSPGNALEQPRTACADAACLPLEPASYDWGFDRGTPIDRLYIETFLDRHREQIRGRVLEVGDATYTWRFGGDRLQQSDVLNLEVGNSASTFTADLTDAPNVPSDAFDCVIVTQTLQLIYDLRSALATVQRVLKPGGTLLATFPGISRISRDEWGGSWHWFFTSDSARRLFGEYFPQVDVEAYGNVLSASAFLYGYAVEEFDRAQLQRRDQNYEVIVAVKAVKGPQPSA